MNDRASQALARVGPDVLTYFRRRVGDDDAPDLLADTMVVAWRRIALLPTDDEGARRWIFGIAHHVLLNHARSERRRSRLSVRLRSVLGSAPATLPADHGIEVRDAIARLEPELAELVRLIHWDGFSLAQAAEVIGRPASTVRNQYARAKAQLRDMLGDPLPATSSRGRY